MAGRVKRTAGVTRITIPDGVASPTRTGKATRAAVRGDHYANAAGLEPIHAIVAWGWGAAFCAGNVVKYVGRYPLKDGERDVGKAAQYLAWLLELMVGAERAAAILEPVVAQLKAGGTFAR